MNKYKIYVALRFCCNIKKAQTSLELLLVRNNDIPLRSNLERERRVLKMHNTCKCSAPLKQPYSSCH